MPLFNGCFLDPPSGRHPHVPPVSLCIEHGADRARSQRVPRLGRRRARTPGRRQRGARPDRGSMPGGERADPVRL